MTNDQLIQQLNEAVSLEFGAFHMYLHFSLVLQGEPRLRWHEFFEAQSQEALGHAKLFSGKIVARGGIPTSQPVAFRRTTDLTEMLRISVATEARAVQLYTALHALVEGQDKPLQYLLEQQIQDEQDDVEEMMKYLGSLGTGTVPTARSARSKTAVEPTVARGYQGAAAHKASSAKATARRAP